ncbi:alpha-tocopherol transfer protein-like [Leguminivora glycinivorella]|uniref:alpha-tocopherol transfer protein-like n=1 Tax=Leguminivora glycinivorella TaxID=1035111 RepID=UPI00200F05ED|nr:alpha-tocopherol transfer protein-like [Leguminivora glycinivorella]
MYNLEAKEDLAINSKLLLNSDEDTLENFFLEHGFSPDYVQDMIRAVHEWYNKEPHLPAGQIHDQMIARLLIARKFSIERVKQKIDNYFTVRHKMPELLRNRDPMAPHLNKVLKSGFWIILPQKTPENHRVTMFRAPYSEGVIISDCFKAIFMMIDYRIWNDSVIFEQIIFDYSNATFLPTVMKQLTPALIWKTVHYLSECLSPNIKGIHIINLPSIAAHALNFIKKMIKPKVAERIHVYKNVQEVFNKFPKDIIPKDLGGTYDATCQDIADAWERTLCTPQWRNYFIQQDSIHTEESKRTTKRNFLDDYGLDGSFTKLNID